MTDYLVFYDGGCTANPGELAVAAVVCTPDFQPLVESVRRAGHGTNNVAEYRALRHAICMANLLGARRPTFLGDSELVVQQVNRWWTIRNEDLKAEHDRVTSALMRFDRWWIRHVPREQNKRADWLVSGLLGHSRTLKKAPAVAAVAVGGEGRPGWSEL